VVCGLFLKFIFFLFLLLNNTYLRDMQYFILLSLFPPEIVNIIFKFVLKDKSANLIYHNLNAYFEKKNILLKSINHIVNHDCIVGYKKYNIGSIEHISCLEYIYYNYYSKEKYHDYFWKNYLHLMSSQLMRLFNRIWIYNMDNNKTKCYQNFKKALYFWLQLCKKHNIELKLAVKCQPYNISNNTYNISYVNAKNITKNLNFRKLVYPPIVLEYYETTHEMDEIDVRESFRYLNNLFCNKVV